MNQSNKCSGCDNNRRPGQRYCLECHAAYIREWRKIHPLTAEQRKKDNCRSYANVYKQRGILTQESCKCGDEDTEMHHEDYDKPLEVIWMCRECHLELHRQKDEEAAA